MSIIENLGQALRSIENKLSPTKDKVTPVALALYADSATKFLIQIRDTLADPTVADALDKYLLTGPAPSGLFREDRDAYKALILRLVPLFRKDATRSPTLFMTTGLSVMIKALSELGDKITQVIPHGGIDLAGDLKLSTALVLGFVDQAIQYGQWCAFAVDHALAVAESDTLIIPKYTFAYLSDNADAVAAFYNEVVIHRDASLVAHILKLKNTARDVSVSGDTGLAANYLSDQNYSDWEHSIADGIVRNPISMLYTMKEEYRLNRIDTLRNRVNWLKERMSLLSMRNMGVDPKSADYKKTHTAVQYYSNLVTDYDRKIAALS